jgi:hypothetical protein
MDLYQNSKREKLETDNLKTKERECHLTNLIAVYIGNYPILSFRSVV